MKSFKITKEVIYDVKLRIRGLELIGDSHIKLFFDNGSDVVLEKEVFEYANLEFVKEDIEIGPKICNLNKHD